VTPLVLAAGVPVSIVLVHRARVGEARRRCGRLRVETEGWLPAGARARIARILERSDVAVAPDDAATMVLGGAATAFVVVGGLAPGLLPLTVIAGVVAIPCALVSLRRRSERRFVAALPVLVDDVVAQLHAGATVVGALLALAARTGPLQVDLTRLETRLRLGSSLSGALTQWARDRHLPELDVVAGGLALAATAGGPSALALDGLARSVRDQLAAQADAAALSAQARMSAVVVGGAPIAYLVFSSMIDGNATRALLGSAAGRLCCGVGFLLEGLGALWMRRIVASQP
jgi:tight adherence protein B